MRKWTWQWLALIGLGWMMLGMFAFVQVDLLPLIPLLDEDAIEVYHEPLYYEHFLVKMLKKETGIEHRVLGGNFGFLV